MKKSQKATDADNGKVVLICAYQLMHRAED